MQCGDPKDPFFTEQLSIVLANSGIVDPERIESYIEVEGYQALHDVLREMTPKEVVDAILKSGLRGRGGAGYPTGLKWAKVRAAPGPKTSPSAPCSRAWLPPSRAGRRRSPACWSVSRRPGACAE